MPSSRASRALRNRFAAVISRNFSADRTSGCALYTRAPSTMNGRTIPVDRDSVYGGGARPPPPPPSKPESKHLFGKVMDLRCNLITAGATQAVSRVSRIKRSLSIEGFAEREILARETSFVSGDYAGERHYPSPFDRACVRVELARVSNFQSLRGSASRCCAIAHRVSRSSPKIDRTSRHFLHPRLERRIPRSGVGNQLLSRL